MLTILSATLAYYKSMTSTLRGPELAAVPVDSIELFDAPTAPGTVASAAASRALTLSVTAFFRDWVRVLISTSASRREVISGISCLLSLSSISCSNLSIAIPERRLSREALLQSRGEACVDISFELWKEGAVKDERGL